MKKFMTIVLVLIFVVSFVGCGAKTTTQSNETKVEDEMEFLYGRWIALDGLSIFEFKKDGTVLDTLTESGDTFTHEYKYQDNKVIIAGNVLAVEEKDGIIYLGDPDQYNSLVREADYDKINK